MIRVITFALGLPFILAACALSDSGAGSPTPQQTEPDAAPTLDPGPIPPDLFAAMVDDAAGRAEVDPSTVTLVSAHAVTWSDGSLGCPDPNMSYTQALVSGYQVVLEAAGTQFDYHASQRGNFVLCPPGRARPPIDG